MIFISLGTQKFQFNRLLMEVDRLIENNIMSDVFAQIGASTYVPRNYNYSSFLDKNVFDHKIETCSFVITHAGTGAIVTALKKNKKVIVVPRLKMYGEHVDDHQVDIAKEFADSGFVEAVYDVSQLELAISKIHNTDYKHFKSNTNNILTIINAFIEKNIS